MLRSISSNWSLNVLNIVVFMVLTPYAASALGNETYGIWEVAVAAAGPLQLMALGLPMATVRAVSRSVAADDPDAASKAVGVSLTMTLLLGALAALLSVGVYGAFSTGLVEGWTDLTAERASDARMAMGILLANVSAGFALALPYALFDAHHDFIARNLIKGLGLLSKLGLTVALLAWKADLAVLACVQIAVAVLEFTTAFLVSRARHPKVRFRPGRLDWPVAKGLLSFSIFAFLLNMGAMLAFRIDALVVGSNSTDPAQAAIYGFGNKIFDPFIQVILAIGMVIMPMAAAQVGKGDLSPVKDAFEKWSKVAATLVFLIGGYLMVLGPEFLSWWLKENYVPESGQLMRVLMASFFLFLPIRGVALPVLMGLGKAKKPGLGLLFMGLVNLGISITLIGPYGLFGVALGTAIPNVIFALYFGREACLALELSPSRWIGYAFLRPLAAMLIAGAALFGLKAALPLAGFWPLFLSGLGYSAVYGIVGLAFVFKGDRHIDVSPILNRLPLLGSRS